MSEVSFKKIYAWIETKNSIKVENLPDLVVSFESEPVRQRSVLLGLFAQLNLDFKRLNGTLESSEAWNLPFYAFSLYKIMNPHFK